MFFDSSVKYTTYFRYLTVGSLSSQPEANIPAGIQRSDSPLPSVTQHVEVQNRLKTPRTLYGTYLDTSRKSRGIPTPKSILYRAIHSHAMLPISTGDSMHPAANGARARRTDTERDLYGGCPRGSREILFSRASSVGLGSLNRENTRTARAQGRVVVVVALSLVDHTSSRAHTWLLLR